jgi:ABC-type antimicrobial peptide transport system permease subunit
LSSAKLIRAYIYEALCLVISSLICGTVIGVVIALTLTLQFNLFLEMPFTFDFPYYLYATLIIMSVIVAFVGSYVPAKSLKEKEIALVLKGL